MGQSGRAGDAVCTVGWTRSPALRGRDDAAAESHAEMVRPERPGDGRGAA